MGRREIILLAVMTYLIIFTATLGFTGLIDFGKGVRVVSNGASFIVKLFRPEKEKSEDEGVSADTTSTTNESRETIEPLTLPGTTVQIPTDSEELETDKQKITEENAANMAKVYSAMDSDKAAKIFKNLTDDEIVILVKFMQKPAIADIFSEMKSSRVAEITSKMIDETENSVITE